MILAMLGFHDLDEDACYRALETKDPRFDGRIFVCVKTTGIYCRPVCPARTPLRKNVTFQTTAAAAEAAGYRACLRCRPETAPRLGAWKGTSNTVSRALAMIEDGALDEGDVEALAARVGVGARQLRRLFDQHLGASPLGVAQTRRVHMAKQLIHDTDLPMAQVALASGFGSVRRFNETFQVLYGRPPVALRRRGAREGQDHVVTLTLRYRPPYDWDAMLGFLAVRAIRGVEVVSDNRYRRTMSFDGHAGTVAVSRAGADQLAVEVRFPSLVALPHILARVRRVFDLAADPLTIGEHLSHDPQLAAMVAARPGLRVPGGWDGFELGVRAVLGQQITVPAAIRLAGVLVEGHGALLPPDLAREGLTHLFPTPQALAAADLSSLPMPGARSRALSSLAAAVVADPSVLSAYASLDEAITRLRRLPGIGDWTAQYIALRLLREPDAFPAADIGLMRALAGPDGVRPTAVELLARAETWRPWRAYAAQHLWSADAHALEIAAKEKAHARQAA